MEVHFLDQFDYTFTADDVMDQLGMPRDHVFRKTVEKAIAAAEDIAKPKAFFMEAEIEDSTENTINVPGQTFHSKVLAENLKDQDIIFPFLCTCGMELVDYCDRLTDIMDQYAFDCVMEFYLRKASVALTGELANMENGRQTSSVNPGSLVDWPIEEQKELFALFGENAHQIGVKLSDSCIMNPMKSVSGLRYFTEEEFHNCQLCQRKNCPTREAEFDLTLFTKTLKQC